MFGAKSKKKEDASNGVMKKSTRGNMDEFEALRTIVSENPGLMARILDKIRIQRTLSGKGPKPEEKTEKTEKTKGAKKK